MFTNSGFLFLSSSIFGRSEELTVRKKAIGMKIYIWHLTTHTWIRYFKYKIFILSKGDQNDDSVNIGIPPSLFYLRNQKRTVEITKFFLMAGGETGNGREVEQAWHGETSGWWPSSWTEWQTQGKSTTPCSCDTEAWVKNCGTSVKFSHVLML